MGKLYANKEFYQISEWTEEETSQQELYSQFIVEKSSRPDYHATQPPTGNILFSKPTSAYLAQTNSYKALC
ncbi:hypothetical protein EB796_024199 [Bugula neritina]|uniref:Uncharacterized protein n=1 Tax=Bugula neritina TaxID=10212 RepID=A0A7J7IU74_BUGNE|nr:hypothetical protein EB796_024199 [Bugula neritina]